MTTSNSDASPLFSPVFSVPGLDGKDRAMDPTRFKKGNRYETNGEFLGFGHGLHKCPGKPFALLDLKVH